jgi:hypothetical protein
MFWRCHNHRRALTHACSGHLDARRSAQPQESVELHELRRFRAPPSAYRPDHHAAEFNTVLLGHQRDAKAGLVANPTGRWGFRLGYRRHPDPLPGKVAHARPGLTSGGTARHAAAAKAGSAPVQTLNPSWAPGGGTRRHLHRAAWSWAEALADTGNALVPLVLQAMPPNPRIRTSDAPALASKFGAQGHTTGEVPASNLRRHRPPKQSAIVVWVNLTPPRIRAAATPHCQS